MSDTENDTDLDSDESYDAVEADLLQRLYKLQMESVENLPIKCYTPENVNAGIFSNIESGIINLENEEDLDDKESEKSIDDVVLLTRFSLLSEERSISVSFFCQNLF